MSEERKENRNVGDEGGISVREIFGIIGKKIWYVLAGTILATLAAMLIFKLALNPAKQSRSMSFKIEYPFCSELKYPDGSVFDYRDIVSEKVIAAAKDNAEYKEEFSSLDTNKILRNEAVAISARRASAELDAPYVYTISLKSAYFKGVNAAHFIDALTRAFITEEIAFKAASLDYKLDEAVFKEASYRDQLTFLTEQKTMILNRYGEWIEEYEEVYRVLGKSLGTHRTEAKTVFADKDRDFIENDLTLKGFEYFNGSVNEEEVKARIIQLQAELKFVRAILEDLKNYNTGAAGYSAVIPYADDNADASAPVGNTTVIVNGNSELMSYVKRSQTIQRQIAYLTGKSSALAGIAIDAMESSDIEKADFGTIVDEIEAFGAKLIKQFNALNESADTLTDVIREIYTQSTLVSFESNSVKSSGGTSIPIVGAAVFVVAFLVFAAVAYFMGRRRDKAKNSAATASALKEPPERTDDDEKTE